MKRRSIMPLRRAAAKSPKGQNSLKLKEKIHGVEYFKVESFKKVFY